MFTALVPPLDRSRSFVLKRIKGELRLFRRRRHLTPLTLTPLHYDLQKVQKHHKVDHQKAGTHERDPPEDLENLPGQERRGDQQSHVFRPGLFQIESDPFRQPYGGVGEQRETEATQQVVRDNGSSIEDEIYEARLRIETHVVSEPKQHVAQVFMHQAQGTHADGDKQQRLAQLESCNQNQPAIVPGLADGDLGFRVDGFLCRARPNFKRAPIDTLNDTG